MSEETPETNNQENAAAVEATNNNQANEVVKTAEKAFEKYLKSARYKHHYDAVSEAKNCLEDDSLDSVLTSLNHINDNVESMKQNAYPCGKAGLYSALEQIQQKAQNVRKEEGEDSEYYNQLEQIAGTVTQIFENRINADKSKASESEGPAFEGQSTENGPAEEQTDEVDNDNGLGDAAEASVEQPAEEDQKRKNTSGSGSALVEQMNQAGVAGSNQGPDQQQPEVEQERKRTLSQ